MTIRIGLIAEDIRFVDFLAPAMSRVAEAAGVPIDLVRTELTRGCRARRLRYWFQALGASSDLIIVAADAKREGRPLTHRQKSRGLRALLDDAAALVPAVAAPSVEAWLLCDARAFAEGLAAGTGIPFRSPPRWPVPASEREAKEALGRLVHDGCGSALARSGFEYAEEIVSRAARLESPSESLLDWARAFRGALLRAAGPAAGDG